MSELAFHWFLPTYGDSRDIGTGIDLIARQVSPGLSAQLKRPFFVENKAGAAGNIGTQEVIRSAPDGSTLLVSVNTLIMNSALRKLCQR